jgi:hypothetical protein
MANVSPGVYSKIIDLSTFVQAVPSTIGFLCGYTQKGRDNELVFVGSRAEFISEFGEPNIVDFGKNYGQGPYIAYNYLGESGSLFWIRCLPDDAAYSHLRIDSSMGASDSSASIFLTYDDSPIEDKDELRSSLLTSGTTQPVGILYPIGRGSFYNQIGVRLTEHSNPTLNGIYVLDIYEKQSDGEDVIIESFEVSFDPNARDNAGDSIWITDVLAVYSSVLRFEMVQKEIDGQPIYSDGYDLVVRTYDKDLGTVSVDLTSGTAEITDNKQDFVDWETDPETGNAEYIIIVKDARGNEIYGWLGASGGTDGESINVFPDRLLTGATQGWSGTGFSVFDPDSVITYEIKRAYASMATPFTSSEPVALRKGSDGSLFDAAGDLDTSVAETLLEQAYSGLLSSPDYGGGYVDEILDEEAIYFSLVYDAGYPSDVKTAILTLCQTRRDCVCILDNGDNATVEASLDSRNNNHLYNSYFAAIYESYNKVSDVFTGADVWFSPIYHMSYIIPRNDNVAEIWFAPAGFNRGAINSIKELRFNPRLGQRDQMYLKQLNPIVRFAQGYTVWGQLTSQAKASALQDLNIVRLVLYIKRAVEQFCRFFIFEQNDPITWGQVSGSIVEFLEVIKAKRGLTAYNVEVGATAYEQKTKKFHVNITLTPTRTVEQIEVNFFIQ